MHYLKNKPGCWRRSVGAESRAGYEVDQAGSEVAENRIQVSPGPWSTKAEEKRGGSYQERTYHPSCAQAQRWRASRCQGKHPVQSTGDTMSPAGQRAHVRTLSKCAHLARQGRRLCVGRVPVRVAQQHRAETRNVAASQRQDQGPAGDSQQQGLRTFWKSKC